LRILSSFSMAATRLSWDAEVSLTQLHQVGKANIQGLSPHLSQKFMVGDHAEKWYQ